MEADEFGKYLRSIRKQRKLTTRQVEIYSGVSNSYISQFETGKRGIPSPSILQKLSTVLKVPYEELMEKAGYLSAEIAETRTDAEQEFIDWVNSEVDGAFFYDFDASPEEHKEQLMKDLHYLWERDKRLRADGKKPAVKSEIGEW